MLSYQHGYHAGNFADVVKHITLVLLLDYLTKKEKPFFYLDTHAGRGKYDLCDKQALKTGEAAQGIALLWAQRNNLPSVFSTYLHHLASLNPDEKLRYYPGSPWLALHTRRSQDRLFFTERHSGEFEYLQALSTPKVHCENVNGLEKLKALLPPPERRGLVFLDPSYEIKTEYREIPEAVHMAYQRFSTGMYCVWYPILHKKQHQRLLMGLQQIPTNQKSLRLEFYLTSSPHASLGMTACGLWVINPPYVLMNQLKTCMNSLCSLYNPGSSFYLLESP